MIYRGFNQRELNRITEILERNRVHYTVSVPDTAMEFINDPTKRVNHAFMDSLLQIEIAAEEFDKINARDIQILLYLRVYKEEEHPFSAEELEKIANPELEVKKPDELARMKQIASILAVLIVGFLYFKKKGLF